jgi:hypothetical protein
MEQIGRLRKLDIADIRKIWPREEQDLSPWITDHIDILNDLLNLQIEIIGKEEYVHNFRLDMVGMENYSKMPVIIENQFGVSDHDHLGKLITYSAGKEAGIVIWIANEIQIAHKEAIEWLNRLSPPEMTFYGVELEVFRIDNSPPAPNLRIVAGPPPGKKKPPAPETPRNKRYLDFFNKLITKILAQKPNFTRAKAWPQSWWNTGIGRSGFSVSTPFTIDNKFRVELYIDTGNKELNDKAFSELKENRVPIEEKIGKELVWDPIPDSRACRIYLAIDGTIEDNQEKLDQIIEWAVPYIIKFKETFSPLVKNIQLEE